MKTPVLSKNRFFIFCGAIISHSIFSPLSYPITESPNLSGTGNSDYDYGDPTGNPDYDYGDNSLDPTNEALTNFPEDLKITKPPNSNDFMTTAAEIDLNEAIEDATPVIEFTTGLPIVLDPPSFTRKPTDLPEIEIPDSETDFNTPMPVLDTFTTKPLEAPFTEPALIEQPVEGSESPIQVSESLLEPDFTKQPQKIDLQTEKPENLENLENPENSEKPENPTLNIETTPSSSSKQSITQDASENKVIAPELVSGIPLPILLKLRTLAERFQYHTVHAHFSLSLFFGWCHRDF